MTTPALYYDANSDAFVHAPSGERADAHELARGTFVDPVAARAGLRRFITFADWQARVAGSVLFRGSIDAAKEELPKWPPETA